MPRLAAKDVSHTGIKLDRELRPRDEAMTTAAMQAAMKIVCPLESTADTQPQLQPALLRLSAMISHYFTPSDSASPVYPTGSDLMPLLHKNLHNLASTNPATSTHVRQTQRTKTPYIKLHLATEYEEQY